MRDLKAQLYFTVHSAPQSAAQLADRVGVSVSYLYRSVLEGDSSCRFPLDLLIPLMEATGDYRVLDHLNARCGRVTTKLPRVGRLKKKDPRTINEISRHFNEVMGAVLEFFENPDPTHVPQIEANLHKHLCEVAALKRTVKEFQQKELF